VTRPHQPIRPIWRCRACAAPWPCGPAKLALLAAHGDSPVALALHLAVTVRDAMDDTWRTGRRPDPAALHDRFLGWLSRRSAHRK
jgi:hypothetical protein